MARRRVILLAVLIMLGIPNVHAQTQDAAPAAQLKALLDEDLDATLRRNPIGATVRGVPGYNHLLPDLSLATLERERARERHALERLKSLDAKAPARPEPDLVRAAARQDGDRRRGAAVSGCRRAGAHDAGWPA